MRAAFEVPDMRKILAAGLRQSTGSERDAGPFQEPRNRRWTPMDADG
jgi:hypothetical protein